MRHFKKKKKMSLRDRVFCRPRMKALTIFRHLF